MFLLLAYYLGRVLPSAGGVPAHPLFFIPRKWRGVREASKKDIISDMLQARGVFCAVVLMILNVLMD